MFETRVYRNLTLQAGAKLALKHRLYVPGWSLIYFLEEMANDETDGEIVIGSLDGEPVCITVSDYHNLMAFCRKALRGNGYTSRCLEKLNCKGLIANIGITGSEKFWSKHGIPLEFAI